MQTLTYAVSGVLLLASCSFHGHAQEINTAKAVKAKTASVRVSPPIGTTSTDTIHLVSNLNQWQLTGEKAIELKRDRGKFLANIDLTSVLQSEQPVVYFNLVKNQQWSHTAASSNGKSNCGYIFTAEQFSHGVHIELANWTGQTKPDDSTSSDNNNPTISATLSGDIRMLNEFAMPPLKRHGDIAIYLPASYRTEPKRTYPVLYMLDGQNLFDNQTAYSVEWRIDEHLEAMAVTDAMQEIIVVAVPNGPERFNEYIPWDFLDMSGQLQTGRGDETIQFIKDTLKPHIDQYFRTQPQSQHTGLAGSSLGGLMAIYAAIAYPEVFGFVGAFSPSMAVQNSHKQPALLAGVNAVKSVTDTRIYIDMGYVEYEGYQEVNSLTEALKAKGAGQIKLVKDDLGRHCEQDWSRRFPQAITWLLADAEKETEIKNAGN